MDAKRFNLDIRILEMTVSFGFNGLTGPYHRPLNHFNMGKLGISAIQTRGDGISLVK